MLRGALSLLVISVGIPESAYNTFTFGNRRTARRVRTGLPECHGMCHEGHASTTDWDRLDDDDDDHDNDDDDDDDDDDDEEMRNEWTINEQTIEPN